MDIYIALVHHPVRDRRGAIITTAITNLDIHDLARSGRTYGLRGVFVVTPIEQQRSLVARLVTHWRDGEGRQHNATRAQAFELLDVASSVEEVRERLARAHGEEPLLIATGAGFDRETSTSYDTLRRRLAHEGGPVLILFGTGWGLAEELVETSDLRLPAIRAGDGISTYNHLSVRSAAAIILDRLLGQR